MSEVLRGDLSSIGLAGVLQLLEGEKHTGWISIGTLGGIAMNRGQIVQAAYQDLNGRPAVLEWLMESSGPFRVERWEAAAGTKPVGQLLSLVMEGVRLLDEWNRIKTRIPRWVERGDYPTLESLGIDGESTFEMLVLSASAPRSLVAKEAKAAADANALASKAGTGVSAVSASTVRREVDYYKAMDDGRSWMTSGDAEKAAVAFRQALAARPGDPVAQLQLNRLRILQSSQNTD